MIHVVCRPAILPGSLLQRRPRGRTRGLAALALLLAAPPAAALAQPGAQPSTVRTRVEFRTRVEQLERDFRGSPADGFTAVALRTLFGLELGPPGAFAAVELADARVYGDDPAPLNTTHVNALELLSAHVALRRSGLLSAGDTVALRAGRLTLNRGSRRLVARNNFRNTVNAFTGLDASWTNGARVVRAFAVLPVTRQPTAAGLLADNDPRLDEENTDALFWGAHVEMPVAAGTRLEAYVVGLHERDGDAASANRRLFTPGVRVLRRGTPGAFEFELEAMLQLGTSRASAAASAVQDLSHRAFAAHVATGYRFDSPWSPRLLLQYDHASGNGDPADDRNGRFDPLFGARAFELGPTGFYGAFARSNISSPGLRLEAAPHERIDLMAAYRLFWLASARDAWTTAGLRDATGASGRFVGGQVEGRVRAWLLPDIARLELGGAALARGAFARDAAGGRDDAAVYVYAQVTAARAWR